LLKTLATMVMSSSSSPVSVGTVITRNRSPRGFKLGDSLLTERRAAKASSETGYSRSKSPLRIHVTECSSGVSRAARASSCSRRNCVRSAAVSVTKRSTEVSRPTVYGISRGSIQRATDS
jgi:hypothetical protein